MKNLANCKPSEFLRQTNRIRKSVSKWLTMTDILNIRKRLPKYEIAAPGSTAEERAEVIRRNAALKRKQASENVMAMLDAVLEDHPDETLELLALCCFVEPEHVDDHTVSEYLEAFSELISDEAVMGFFTSLSKLGLRNTSQE